MIRKLALGGVAILAAAVAILGVQLAQAHSRPVILNPAPGSILSAAPAQVSGSFTAALRRDPNWTFIQVADQNGARVDTGDVTLNTDRLQMSIALKSGLGPGRYLVTWRTYDDADGAVFGDCYVFFVGQAAADAAIAAKGRLDGGRDCQRIDVSAKDGTPVAGGTPQGTPAAAAADDHDDDAADGAAADVTSDGGDDGVPVWSLVVVGFVGLVAGGAGMRLLGPRGNA
ncbi:MAG TPA: copper resistance protein CopC [Dehalococcoidia bacterium]|nr:copper resistance protein CopC [Dehalococcoidia bacterium]